MILKVTEPDGKVRAATREEEDRFIAEVGETNPLSIQILNQRQADETGPVRKPSDGPNRSRNRKGTKAF